MSRSPRPPRVVAELGRPETAEERANRLATNSKNYRSRKTINNLVYSLLATLGAVIVLVLIVPRSDTPINREVDYASVAEQAQSGVKEPLVVPVLPPGWSANAAQWRQGGNDGVSSWYLGLLTPENEFIGLTQAVDANPTWLADQLEDVEPTDTITIAGLDWAVYRNPAPVADRGNFESALVTEAGDSSYLLIGTATDEELTVLAAAVAEQISTEPTGTEQNGSSE
ncbi:DUF4245 domain-containing protein [Cryobacterium zongtaii]|uniref:DUF4245 domain-containing protein n=1 Tax=Cryobacterium zongtaii TaxID=1259217 RepID=A0A2S3ZQ48_9MICO|nr:DUF4245 domain-containing protein [Cryobacterium zongtaii]POH71330.1 DUF4245 domain-containing protein [Cryobacterium zongtaii]